jgi:release factor glutamine methyltransferase
MDKSSFLLTLLLMTIANARDLFKKELSSVYSGGEIDSLYYYTIEHVCRVNHACILTNKTKLLSAVQEASLGLILDELKTGKPIQYILGETAFYGLRLKVNSSVLIPRPETEELVDWVLKEIKDKGFEVEGVRSGAQSRNREWPERGLKILDIGTGSGCIPIVLKKHLPEAEVFGLDISAKALETAMRNAVLNGTEVRFVKGDILRVMSGEFSAFNSGTFTFPLSAFDLIISNPPYIAQKEKEQMHRNVLQHEPHIALFVSDNEPLLFYSGIADFAKEHLRDAGELFFEVNEAYGNEIVAMLNQKGFKEIELRKDMQGKDRMVRAVREI